MPSRCMMSAWLAPVSTRTGSLPPRIRKPNVGMRVRTPMLRPSTRKLDSMSMSMRLKSLISRAIRPSFLIDPSERGIDICLAHTGVNGVSACGLVALIAWSWTCGAATCAVCGYEAVGRLHLFRVRRASGWAPRQQRNVVRVSGRAVWHDDLPVLIDNIFVANRGPIVANRGPNVGSTICLTMRSRTWSMPASTAPHRARYVFLGRRRTTAPAAAGRTGGAATSGPDLTSILTAKLHVSSPRHERRRGHACVQGHNVGDTDP